MLPTEYETMFLLEDRHWWYAGLRGLVLASLEAIGKRRSMRVLDAGCGTGGLLARLGGRSWGVEIADAGISLCRRRGLKNLVQSSVTRLPFRAGSFDAVVSLDVLCHQWVPDDVEVLAELRRVLVRGGVAIIQVPAFRILRGAHDEAVLSPRRYTRGETIEKLQAAGFRPLRVTYRNTLLFPLVAPVRLLRRPRRGRPCTSDLFSLPRPLNGALRAVLALENAVVRRLRLPFGLSVFAVAENP